MKTSRRSARIGQGFDEFLAEEGLLEECEQRALKEILADQVRSAMAEHKLTKTAMAARMRTSRRALDRLLVDPQNDGVTLHTLQKAARAIGKRLEINLV